jgi:hypothetical protein
MCCRLSSFATLPYMEFKNFDVDTVRAALESAKNARNTVGRNQSCSGVHARFAGAPRVGSVEEQVQRVMKAQ